MKESTRANCLGGGGWHKPFKDGADLAWILSGGWSTARLVNSTSPGYPSSRLRTSVTSASWLTTICRCKFTSTMLHELASTIYVNCESSGVLSRQHGSLPGPSSCAQPTQLLQWSSRWYVSVPDWSASIRSPAAARLVLGLPKWASVSDAMHDIPHWLPFPERVEFKLCSVVYKCLHDSAPRYLSQYCIPAASLPGRSHLRSEHKYNCRIRSELLIKTSLFINLFS